MSLHHTPFAGLPAIDNLGKDLRKNLPDSERKFSAVAGAVALALATTTRGPARLVLGVLGAALLGRGWTGQCPLYRSQGIDRRHDSSGVPADHGIKFEHEIEINRSPSVLYAFWRDLEQLPKVMSHVLEIRRLSERRSHWKVQGPLNQTVEWDAQIIHELPDELIAWETLPGATVGSTGSVWFEPTDSGGTLLRIKLAYYPPAGPFGAAIAALLGASPEVELKADLARFKEFAERELAVFADSAA